MKATDLRIGNYIKVKTSNDAAIYQIGGIDGWERRYSKEDAIITFRKQKTNMGKSFEDFRQVRLWGGARDNEILPEDKLKPIPLTIEWAQRFGFTGNDGEKDYSNVYCCDGVSIQFGDHAEGPETLDHIKYVHQLQNLYFALTGKELQFQ